MNFTLSKWIKFSLLNLLVVASLGVCLRYKILYPLPFVHQKHLLHSHSHFAFTGWISQTLMVLIVAYLAKNLNKNLFKKYHYLLLLNFIIAWGMLVTFIYQGYGVLSITFSTGSIIISYVFAFFVWNDLNKFSTKDVTSLWIKVGIVSNAVSSIGAFALAYFMVNKIINQNGYILAEYFFLHFQYNGWFFFGCMGLISSYYFKNIIGENHLRKIFYCFAFALIPAFFLSALWMKLPLWIYIIIVISAFLQIIGWIYLVKLIKQNFTLIITKRNIKIANTILLFSSVALTFKLLLQLGSTIPALSTLAFGFRPIVIGYLHLVLLGVISLSLLAYILTYPIFEHNKFIVKGALYFSLFIILNELLLMIQGMAALDYILVPYINEALFVTAILLFTSMLYLFYGVIKSKTISNPH